jgi:hypothetical protein
LNLKIGSNKGQLNAATVSYTVLDKTYTIHSPDHLSKKRNRRAAFGEVLAEPQLAYLLQQVLSQTLVHIKYSPYGNATH